MEKPAIRNTAVFKRLLARGIFLAVSALAFSAPSWAAIHTLRFRQSQESIFTEMDNSFYVDVPGVTPDSIQIYVNSLPANASLVSLKKESAMIPVEYGSDKRVAGSRVTLWMRFSKTGSYNIGSVDLIIDRSFYKIPFNSVVVRENPRYIFPEVTIHFADEKMNKGSGAPISISEGSHILFTVYERHALSVQNIYWNIPEDSIFKEVKRYEFTSPSKESAYSSERRPVAMFDWQPVSQGERQLPEIFVSAISYDGTTKELKCPQPAFSIVPPAEDAKGEGEEFGEESETPFAYAFAEIASAKSVSKSQATKNVDIKKLLSLYEKEKRSLPFFTQASRIRRAEEEAAGLPSAKFIPNDALFWASIALSGISLAFLIFSAATKRKTLTLYAVLVALACSVSAGIYSRKFFVRYGIFDGESISPIPEKNITSSVALQRGSVVSIARTAGDWLYVRANETSGWVSKDKVHIIK